MARKYTTFTLLLLYYVHHFSSEAKKVGLEVIPERCELVYANPKYVSNVTTNVRRYSRKGGYLFTLKGNNHHVWANNVTFNIVAYEYLHNEYKRSFIEFHWKLCDFMSDPLFKYIPTTYGITCPMRSQYWAIDNATIKFPTFQSVFPFSRGKAALSIMRILPTEELIGSLDLFITLKQVS